MKKSNWFWIVVAAVSAVVATFTALVLIGNRKKNSYYDEIEDLDELDALEDAEEVAEDAEEASDDTDAE